MVDGVVLVSGQADTTLRLVRQTHDGQEQDEQRRPLHPTLLTSGGKG